MPARAPCQQSSMSPHQPRTIPWGRASYAYVCASVKTGKSAAMAPRNGPRRRLRTKTQMHRQKTQKPRMPGSRDAIRPSPKEMLAPNRVSKIKERRIEICPMQDSRPGCAETRQPAEQDSNELVVPEGFKRGAQQRIGKIECGDQQEHDALSACGSGLFAKAGH